MISKIRTAVLFAIYGSLSAPAHAYLDGATASMLLQGIIGAVATWIMYSKVFAAKMKSLVLRVVRNRHSTDEAQ